MRRLAAYAGSPAHPGDVEAGVAPGHEQLRQLEPSGVEFLDRAFAAALVPLERSPRRGGLGSVGIASRADSVKKLDRSSREVQDRRRARLRRAVPSVCHDRERERSVPMTARSQDLTSDGLSRSLWRDDGSKELAAALADLRRRQATRLLRDALCGENDG